MQEQSLTRWTIFPAPELGFVASRTTSRECVGLTLSVAAMQQKKSTGTNSPLGHTAEWKDWRHDATQSHNPADLRGASRLHTRLTGGPASIRHHDNGRTIGRAGA